LPEIFMNNMMIDFFMSPCSSRGDMYGMSSPEKVDYKINKHLRGILNSIKKLS